MANDHESQTFWGGRFDLVMNLFFIAWVSVMGVIYAMKEWGTWAAVACGMLGARCCWYLLGPGRARVVIGGGVITVHDLLFLKRTAPLSEVKAIAEVEARDDKSAYLEILLHGEKTIPVPFLQGLDTAQKMLDAVRAQMGSTDQGPGAAHVSQDDPPVIAPPVAPPLQPLAPPHPAEPPTVEAALAATPAAPVTPPAAGAPPMCVNCGKALGPDECGWGPGPHFWQRCSECGAEDVYGILSAD